MRKAMPAAMFFIIILYAASISLNLYFKTHLVRSTEEKDIIERMFGGLRGFIGDWAFMKAEEYHHRGLPFLKAAAYHEGEAFSVEETHPVEEHAAPENKTFFSKIYAAVKVTEDSHLKPAEEKEVLPWFYVETVFDPHDIRGYVLGAYWLERMGRPGESMKFLQEGERNNPASASILGSMGHLYYIENDIGKAIDYLERSRALWLEGLPPNDASDRYSRSDRFFSLDLLGQLYEKRGQIEKAVDIYKELYRLEPNNSVLNKIERLAK